MDWTIGLDTVLAQELVRVTDRTKNATSAGWLSPAAVIDLIARKVVGWARGATMTSDLALTALLAAIWFRRLGVKVRIQSDQSSRFNSEYG